MSRFIDILKETSSVQDDTEDMEGSYTETSDIMEEIIQAFMKINKPKGKRMLKFMEDMDTIYDKCTEINKILKKW